MRRYWVRPTWWTGATGMACRHYPAARIVGTYLMTCHHANPYGLYYVPLSIMSLETGYAPDEVRHALAFLERVGFAQYDEVTQTVWVIEMAAQQFTVPVKPTDSNSRKANRWYQETVKSPFLGPWWDRYVEDLSLSTPRRTYQEDRVPARVTPPDILKTTALAATNFALTPPIMATRPLPRLPQKLRVASVKDAMAGDARFGLFWQQYPRKDAKLAAWKAWNRLLMTEELFAQILRALEQSKKRPDWLKNQGQYIPLPSTWINQERWKDEGTTIPHMTPRTIRSLIETDRFLSDTTNHDDAMQLFRKRDSS